MTIQQEIETILKANRPTLVEKVGRHWMLVDVETGITFARKTTKREANNIAADRNAASRSNCDVNAIARSAADMIIDGIL